MYTVYMIFAAILVVSFITGSIVTIIEHKHDSKNDSEKSNVPSQNTVTPAVNQVVQPVTNQVINQTQPVTRQVMNQVQPVTNQMINQTQPVTNQAINQTQPVTNSVVNQAVQPVVNPLINQVAQPTTNPVGVVQTINNVPVQQMDKMVVGVVGGVEQNTSSNQPEIIVSNALMDEELL